MNQQIPTRKPDWELITKKKKTCQLVDFAVSADYSVKIKESENIDKYLDLARELKKVLEREHDGDTSCSWSPCNCPQKFEKETGGIGDQRKNQDHLDHSNAKIIWIT